MNTRLITLLACPVCRAAVELEGDTPDPIVVEATLVCTACATRYPVVSGIPRMTVPGQQLATAASFEEEFSHAENSDDMDPYELRRFHFFSRAGIDPRFFDHFRADYYRTSLEGDAYSPDASFLANRTVLDAGCGPGRFTEVAAREGAAYVVGLDLGGHIERAAKRCRDLPNVDFVQGSVLNPPLRNGAFDYAFSIGVLHHTGDAESAFGSLADLVADPGALSVWVYAPEYWGGRIRGPIARRIHAWMSRLSPERATRIARRWLFPFGVLQMKVDGIPGLKWLLAPMYLIPIPRHPRREVMIATILDYYTPRYISTHTPEELVTWARGAGFGDVESLPVASSVLARR